MGEESSWRETFLPEHELLLCCARTRFSDAHAARVRELMAAGVNWEGALSLALTHAVMPLLHRDLLLVGSEEAPAPFREKLRALCLANSYRNLSLIVKLLTVLTHLNANGIHHGV